MMPGVIRLRTRESGSVSPRARAANANGIQIAVVDGTAAVTDCEANDAPIKSVSHSPMQLHTARWPAKVRLYARWQTQRGEVSSWSLPLTVTVV
jgi:hypothetical protein